MDLFSSLQKNEQSILSHVGSADIHGWFRALSGSNGVLVSAPHACAHKRNGILKMAEEYTAAIAMYLAQHTGCHAIFTINESEEDPNWQPGGRYKEAIRDIVRQYDIQLLIDLHGMTNRYHMGVALGTMLGRSVAQAEVLGAFLDVGFVVTAADDLPAKLIGKDRVAIDSQQGAARNESWRRLVVDHPRFTGGVRSHTVTRYACEELGIKSLQVELASVARIVHCPKTPDWPYEYSGNPHAIKASVNALSAIIAVNS